MNTTPLANPRVAARVASVLTPFLVATQATPEGSEGTEGTAQALEQVLTEEGVIEPSDGACTFEVWPHAEQGSLIAVNTEPGAFFHLTPDGQFWF